MGLLSLTAAELLSAAATLERMQKIIQILEKEKSVLFEMWRALFYGILCRRRTYTCLIHDSK